MIDDIPETLDEAIDTLIAQMSAKDRAWFTRDSSAPATIHHGPGTALRNDWELWEATSPLSQWFRARGIWHGDDKSGIIFDALAVRLRGETFDLPAQVARYTEFWRQRGLGFDGVDIPGHGQ